MYLGFTKVKLFQIINIEKKWIEKKNIGIDRKGRVCNNQLKKTIYLYKRKESNNSFIGRRTQVKRLYVPVMESRHPHPTTET